MRVGVVAVALLVALSVGVLLPNHPAGRDPAEDAGVFFYAARPASARSRRCGRR